MNDGKSNKKTGPFFVSTAECRKFRFRPFVFILNVYQKFRIQAHSSAQRTQKTTFENDKKKIEIIESYHCRHTSGLPYSHSNRAFLFWIPLCQTVGHFVYIRIFCHKKKRYAKSNNGFSLFRERVPKKVNSKWIKLCRIWTLHTWAPKSKHRKNRNNIRSPTRSIDKHAHFTKIIIIKFRL